MTTDNLFVGEKAREKMMDGVKKAAHALAVTMGTSGSNSLIECIERPGHYPTNDGETILKNIKFADPLEEMGRSGLYEAVSRANKANGDGSSTTAVLTAAILEIGMKHIGEVSPMEIKRSLEKCIPIIEKSVKSQAKGITIDEVASVASISAEDEGIGEMIQKIYKEIGKDGIMEWDTSKTAEDSYSIGTGLTISGATYISPYMCDIDESGGFTKGIRWTDPKVLLCRQKITSAAEFNELFQSLFNKNVRELAIFCEEIEVPVIADLIRTRAVRGFKSVVIKMPVLWRDEWWEDLALASGGKIVDSVGLSLRNVKEEHLGTFGHLTVDREDTFIDGIKDLTLHIANLQANGDDASLLRASRLNTRTARYFVGAHSESALAYRRLKVEDAISAAGRALEGGIVPGGGVALFQATKSLPDNEIGGRILREALKAPFKHIVQNAGGPKELFETQKFSWIHKLLTRLGVSLKRKVKLRLKRGMGFDSKTGKTVDMFKAGIVDPADVVLNSVRNAIGVAASILTIGTVVILPREEQVMPFPTTIAR